MNRSLETKALGLALLVAVTSLGGALLAGPPIQRMTASNPKEVAFPSSSPELATSPELIVQGRHEFDLSCATCHGDDAHGDEGPDLHNLTLSRARIAATIKKGVKGEMPAFAKKYDDPAVSALVSYLQTLR